MSKTYGIPLEDHGGTALDLFNQVGGINTTLTIQNIHYLLSESFVKEGVCDSTEAYEKLQTKGCVDIVVTPSRETRKDIDNFLRDAVLKFLLQEPPENKASFALCKGNINQDGTITGNTHWTSLHLRRNTDGSITPYYTDSLGGKTPQYVINCLKNIKNIKLDDLKKNNGWFSNPGDSIKAYIVRFNQGRHKVTINDPVEIKVEQQKGLSCGYHSVFNAINLFRASNENLQRKTLWMEKGAAHEFVIKYMAILKSHFNPKRALTTKPQEPSAKSSVTEEILSAILLSDDNPLKKLRLIFDIEGASKDSKEGISEEQKKHCKSCYNKIMTDLFEFLPMELAKAKGVFQERDIYDILTHLNTTQIFDNPRIVIEELENLVESKNKEAMNRLLLKIKPPLPKPKPTPNPEKHQLPLISKEKQEEARKIDDVITIIRTKDIDEPAKKRKINELVKNNFRPKQYCGMGIDADFVHDPATRTITFTVKEVFTGGFAQEQLGLAAGEVMKIKYKAGTRDPLKTIISEFRNIDLQSAESFEITKENKTLQTDIQNPNKKQGDYIASGADNKKIVAKDHAKFLELLEAQKEALLAIRTSKSQDQGGR